METKIKNPRYAVLSLSGGMDSSTLLLRLLSEGYECTCISFDYGQKHSVELERAKSLVEYINDTLVNYPQSIKDMLQEKIGDDEFGDRERIFKEVMINPVKYQVIKLDGLSQLLNSALVTGGAEVPEGHYAEENMKATVVPNRNKIFSSIIQAVALSIAESKNTEVHIAMGVHSGDHTIYPDCTEEFRNADEYAFKIGNWNSELVNFYTPYMEGNKFTILQDGEKCCEVLGLDFDEVYKRTNTSYKPIKHVVFYDDGTASEEWFSDYKSASSVERVEAFIKLGRNDAVSYADEFGPVTWEFVKEYVSSVLDEHSKTV
jgi:7-cyano-7-deazaguanine synthase